ncbi:protein containing DUF11 [Candidatus Thiomargarita nelsonii]|uniref:Protein containing DUF11 n=1 Tax=Candidatus Thiomargarita nelsonii TaxID=1003181 RepID=A0A176RXD5_9GAMM|nr:protein containing DUF11 [Candidatus Thiomargarita nelsonii]
MTTTLTVDWTVPASGDPFDIYAVADPNGTVTESDETNNTAHFFAAVPDLTVEGVQVAYGSGQDITLTATLSNTGVVTATPVDVAFRLDDPITGTVVATASAASLEAGAETEVQVVWDATSTPTDSYLIYAVADPDDVVVEADEANNDEWASVGILPDLVLRSTSIVASTLPDGSLMVNFRVFNEGIRDANGVIVGIYDQLPTPSTTPLVSTTLDIPAGENQVAVLNLADYPGSGFYIGVGIQSEFKDRNVGDNVILVPFVDLSLSKSDAPDPVNVGQDLTYTLTVTNNGPDAATGVTLIDTLPAEVTLVSDNPSQGSCSGTSTITCDLETLNNGDSATVTIVVTPTAVGELSNTASVTGNEPDPNTANNSATISTTVN